MENDKNDFDELLVLYALGELEPDEALVVEEELKKHPELAEKIEKFIFTDRTLSKVFAQSDEVALQKLAKESADTPKVADKTEKPKSHLGRRLALSVAALALILVVGALLYPQFVSEDVNNARTLNEYSSNSHKYGVPVVGSPKRSYWPDFSFFGGSRQKRLASANYEESASAVEDTSVQNDAAPVQEDTLEESPQQSEALDDALGIRRIEENEDSDDMLPLLSDKEPLNTAAPAPAAATDPATEPPTELPMENAATVRNEAEPEEAHAQYFMRNALYDIPSQKTADGMAPIKGETPPIKEELLHESAPDKMAAGDQMNKSLESQQRIRFGKRSPEPIKTTRGISDIDKTAPVKDSYATLRKSVLIEDKLPNPADINVDQWLSYFGVIELAYTTQGKSVDADNKDDKFVNAVRQFGALLSKGEPSCANEYSENINACSEIMRMLRVSVGDDEKRREFMSIVVKTNILYTKGLFEEIRRERNRPLE